MDFLYYNVRILRVVLMVAGLLLLIPILAASQVNTESMRVVSDLVGYRASLSLSGQIKGGNKELTSIGSSARAEFRNGNHVWFVVGTFKFLQPGEVVHLNSGFSHTRYGYYFTERLSLELLGQMEYDHARLLNRRAVAGAGLRLRIFKSEDTMLYLGFTPILDSEKLDATKVTDEDPNSTVARLSSFLVLRVPFAGGATFVSTSYIQPQIGDTGDVRILEEAALSFPVTERLSFTSTFYLRHDSRPPTILKATDYTLTTGISLSL